MIKYTLDCSAGHRFESWFQSGAAFDNLRARELVSCPICGTTTVSKAIMAPAVQTAEAAPQPNKLQALRARIEATSDYVGQNFAAEARAIHAGDAPERAIYGEAKPAEAKALLDEGVPILPLPFIPKRNTN